MKRQPRVTGIGGIFFKAQNAPKLRAWYEKHLGLPLEAWGGCQFFWRDAKRPGKKGYTVWSAFEGDTGYFKPSKKPFMINYRVDDLKRVLAELKKEGVAVDEKTEESEFGKFGWVMDPEGHRIELWEPPKPKQKRRGAR
jgi:catechol 2,3-dioxygenase-like lactoylglutathione lyase family enzyme